MRTHDEALRDRLNDAGWQRSAEAAQRVHLRGAELGDFYEFFHGDNGAGLGASHQTGWTGIVAKLIQLFGLLDAQKSLATGKAAAFIPGRSKPEAKK